MVTDNPPFPQHRIIQRSPLELPTDFLDKISTIISARIPPLKQSSFNFEMSESAAKHNATILQQYDYDMTRVISAMNNSHIGYGSEFRPVSIFQSIFQKIPFWKEVQLTLSRVAKYPLERISNQCRLIKLEESICRGNHQSAVKNPVVLNKLIDKEAKMGFQLPITIDSIRNMPHACIAPYGIIEQQTIDESGKQIPKFTMAQNQSFKSSSATSINSRVKRNKLLNLVYGNTFRRILHCIHWLCFHYPSDPILVGKFNFSLAYRQMTMWGHSAAASCTKFNNIGYVSLRLTFGGSPCPFLWCSASKMITDLANDLLFFQAWDPTTILSPH